ncbi:glycogen debranching protein GlgX [Mesorhizobium sediminum]|uniref:glycogen debranching protein GlgX n=1 Tax=Neoaquamicrobium sediminum TaxID=1849104 RepID=UPI003615C987
MSEGLQPGAVLEAGGIRFSVWSGAAERIWVSIFDDHDRETDRVELARGAEGMFSAEIAGLGEGARYGLRADGPSDPQHGLWFDPDKLLVDPYALEIDRPYAYDARLAARRGEGGDTAPLMPKALVRKLPRVVVAPPRFRPGGLIYELNVRGFTMRHPAVTEHLRGTIGALAHPAVIEHLVGLGVGAVELMPITAWMDERHLPPLGLRNAWGYNPVTFMALDPRLAPGGWAELRKTVAAFHEAGIGVILDLVFNHTAESDALGPTLSLRGLDARAYYRHDAYGRLVNDTGTGHTVACDHPAMQRLVLDSLRTFVRHAGVDGFRFDLAPILGRDANGFRADAPLLRAMIEDEILRDRILIAEPWDIGPGGYQLGNFQPPFLEWNDRFRDDVRRFWRGDAGMVGSLATRLAGSFDVFSGNATRSVNFLAAHDGMTLRDLVSYECKHNLANGEDNRDGHDDNLSWNHGVEGETADEAVVAARRQDIKALLASLFASRGTIMLTAGDEFGRTQGGNNNAYAQDNAITWLDWEGRDEELEAFVRALSGLRRTIAALRETTRLQDGEVCWLREDGAPMIVTDWEDPTRRYLTMVLGGLRVEIGPDEVKWHEMESDDGRD